MRDSNRPHRKSESGVAGLIAAALAIALLAMASLVVDGGLALKARSELDNAMDAAVLAGAMELPDTAQATALAQQFLDANQSTVGLLGTPTVTFSFPGSDSDLIQATGTIPVTTLLTGVDGNRQYLSGLHVDRSIGGSGSGIAVRSVCQHVFREPRVSVRLSG